MFNTKWYRLRINEWDPDRTVILHDNGFTTVSTRSFEPGIDHYVLPSQLGEEDDAEDQDVIYVWDEELEEYKPNVLEYNVVLDDSVDEDMLENDVDDDVDIVNPFNTFFELEDTYFELDKELED